MRADAKYTDEYGNVILPCGSFVGSSRRLASAPADWLHKYHPRLAQGVYAWEPYPTEQLRALDVVVPALIKAYPTIKWIVSHEEVDTRGWKTDPGFCFPMARYTRHLASAPPLDVPLPDVPGPPYIDTHNPAPTVGDRIKGWLGL
jgi:hypothetical protein